MTDNELLHDDAWRDRDNPTVWQSIRDRLLQARPWSNDE